MLEVCPGVPPLTVHVDFGVSSAEAACGGDPSTALACEVDELPAATPAKLASAAHSIAKSGAALADANAESLARRIRLRDATLKAVAKLVTKVGRALDDGAVTQAVADDLVARAGRIT